MARMTSFVAHTTVDCRNAYELSQVWKQILGYQDLPDDPNLPGHEECMIRDPETGHRILFIEVPDPTPGKNKVHFDLRPRTSTREEEVERLAGLGFPVTDDQRRPDGSGWVVLADPEGNLFCILRSQGEVDAGPS